MESKDFKKSRGIILTKKIQNIFSEVPKTYERVNHILTLGLDMIWRKRAAGLAAQKGGSHWIDMCSGTGETAVYLKRLASSNTKVYAADFSLPMLQKVLGKPAGKGLHVLVSDVNSLSVPDATFDLITISFATRNINLSRDVLINTFKEFYRVLKPGGLFVNLETSQPNNSFIRKLFHKYIKLFVLSIGSWISGSKAGYAYLAGTIPRFYFPDALADILKQAGFEKVRYQRMLFGVAAIHQGIKEIN